MTARAADALTATLAPALLAGWCAGHFPGDPFVPGAYLVEAMATAAGLLAASAATVPHVVRAAFHRPVRPAAAVTVAVRRAPDGALQAEVRADGTVAARATVRFEAGA